MKTPRILSGPSLIWLGLGAVGLALCAPLTLAREAPSLRIDGEFPHYFRRPDGQDWAVLVERRR